MTSSPRCEGSARQCSLVCRAGPRLREDEMVILQTRMQVEAITASEIFDFLANPDDESYRVLVARYASSAPHRRAWPRTHRRVVYMDEYVGKRRLRMSAVVTEAAPGKKLDWQLRKRIRLPARLSLELEDYEGGVEITHTVRTGFRGVGRVLDPVLKIVMSEGFARDLDHHVRTEFPLLRDLLRKRRAGAPCRPAVDCPPTRVGGASCAEASTLTSTSPWETAAMEGPRTGSERLDLIATGLEEAGWAAFIFDSEWRFVWISSEFKALLGEADPTRLGLGEHTLVVQSYPAWDLFEPEFDRAWLLLRISLIMADTDKTPDELAPPHQRLGYADTPC
jgi:hypothetical protein